MKLPNSQADLAKARSFSGSLRAVPRAERRGRPRAHADPGEAVARRRTTPRWSKSLRKVFAAPKCPAPAPCPTTKSGRRLHTCARSGKVSLKPVPGNPPHGAEIYRGKGGCATCHSIKGEGGISAPDLAGIGVRRSAAYLRESLVDPAAAVPEGICW